MPEAARRHAAVDDVPITDPAAVEHAYRRERARRRARLEHQRAQRLARLRFLAALGLLLVLSFVLALTVWHQVQRLFGL